MLRRPLLLAAAFLAVAVAALLGGDALSAEHYRQFLFWGLPLAVGGLSLAILPTVPSSVPALPRLRLVVWAGAALMVAQAAVPLAFRQGWLTFTYGDQKLAASPALAVAWGLPLALVLGVCGWEWGLRRTLFSAAMRSGRPLLAWAVTLVCGVALALPSLIPRLVVSDRDFFLAGLVVAFCREVALTLLYRRGGLVFAGIGRGFLLVMDAIVLNDVVSPHFPAANYVVGDPRFYVLRALFAVLALLVVALSCRQGARARRLA